MTSETDTRARITRIWARNFRSIEKLDLELGPLTVLVGPNASGKSNVMDVLRFITDATRGDLDSAISIRNGIGAIRRHSAKGRPYDVELGFRLEGRNAAVQYSVVLGSGPAGRYRVKREYGFVQESTTSPRRQFEIRAGNLTEPKASSVADQSQFQPLWADFRSIDDTSINFRDLALISSPPTLPRTPQERSKLQEASRERSALARFTTSMSFYRLFPDTIRIPRRPGNPHRLNEQGGNLDSLVKSPCRSN